MRLRSIARATAFALSLPCAAPMAQAEPAPCGTGIGSTTFVGSATVTTQADADQLACYERIVGALNIADSSELAIGLPKLRAVYGPVHIVYSSDASAQQVRAVSMPQLQTIAGSLTLDYPGASGAFYGAQIAFGLDMLVNMLGNLTVNVQNQGANLSGLRSLERLFGSLKVTVASGDVAGFNFLDKLRTVTGDVTFSEGHNTFGLMRTLVQIGGTLHLEGLLFVLGPQGQSNFGALESVGKNVELRSVSLSVQGALVPLLHALTFVGKKLDLEHVTSFDATPLPLPLGSTRALRVGSLRLVASGFDALDASPIRVSPFGSITIEDNPALCQSDVDQFVSEQMARGFFGAATSGGNASCP